MKLSKEELMIEQAQGFSRRQKWLPRIYAIMLLSFTGVYAVLMNYNEAVSKRWHGMTIGYSLMIGSFAFLYGSWLTFTYLMVEGKDGKSSQWIFSSVCYMPFSIENLSVWVEKSVMDKMKLYSGCVLLILAAGMFIGPRDDEKMGISLYMPESWFVAIMVCMVGTLFVFLCMYVGHKVLLNSVVDKELKKRSGGKGKKHGIK